MLSFGFNEAIFFTRDKCNIFGLFCLKCEFMVLFGIVKAQNNAMELVKQKKKKLDIHFQVEADYAPCCKRIGLGKHAKSTLLSFEIKERKIWTYGWMVVFTH